MPQVLFLCTANYYRSRFAELLFNALAPQLAPDWSAFSRALAIEENWCNKGPISMHTRNACRQRAIAIAEPIREPCGVTDSDFAAAARIIAVKEAEHRPYVVERHPHRLKSVEFWQVHDLDASGPVETCDLIERNVRALLAELGSDKPDSAYSAEAKR
jgi:low molecular weight protein-tyrosine phosphatase